MLTYDDNPTIRNAITKRIGKEPGVMIIGIRIAKRDDEGGKSFIAVGIDLEIDHHLRTQTRFDLPAEFDYRHLHDEIDECAEQVKAARKEFFGKGGLVMVKPGGVLAGNGLRGNWRKYA